MNFSFITGNAQAAWLGTFVCLYSCGTAWELHPTSLVVALLIC
jgi:hypothetical protein